MTISIRDLQGMDEFRVAEQLQVDVWGADEMPDPADLMMVIQHEGGLIAGAFEGDRLLGYVFAFPTRDSGVQHSHRLAVRTEARGLQLGARLKWYQHDWCAARGIRHVRWTYDPARRANATLNIAKLGAEASTYLTDYYGALPGINAGTATDRVMADWWIGSDRVRATREGRASLTPDQLASAHRVPIPEDFERLLQIDPPAAQSARMAMRAALTSAFDRGLFIAGMDRATGDYLLLPR
jgi:predicted GNAT superfamily acetyltransferase